MTNEKLQQFLQKTGFITAGQAAEIAAQFTARALAKNEFLLQAGQVSNAYFFLSHGFLRAFAYDTEGNDITTGFYGPNQMVFEVSSFFNRTTSRENIQALTDCEGWVINYQHLNGLFHARPEFREFGRSMLVRGYAGLKDRMLALITETAAERYEALVRTHPEIVQHAALKNVATYLGITDTSLSRIRKGNRKK